MKNVGNVRRKKRIVTDDRAQNIDSNNETTQIFHQHKTLQLQQWSETI